MPLVSLANVRCAFGSRVVLDGATMSVEPGEKIGLVGRNGCGKTTLMRIMQGTVAPDAGDVQVARGARIGFLRQDPQFDPDETVRDAAEGAFAELHRLHRRLDEVYAAMAEAGPDELDRLLRRQADLEARLEAAGGYAVDHRVEAALHGLGFTDGQMRLPTAALSGGQRSRLGLARLLLEEPDLLLLDEPTNHLDLEGRRWLERFLAEEYPGAVVLVSHDRWLLDRVAGRIVEIEQGGLNEYPGNYARYVELRAQQRLTQQRTRQKQLDRIRREEAFIRRYRAGQRARQARGRESRLERYRETELIEPPPDADVMRLTLPPAPRSGDRVVVAEGLSLRYGPTVLFEDVGLEVRRGDRVGVIGPNGSGKTTLVNCLLGETRPDAGTVRSGSRLSIGYYRQVPRGLDLDLPVWRYLQSVIVALDGRAQASEQQARDLAGAFLFSGLEQDKALRDLSGGERARAVLAGLVSAAHNLLVLDEPTNHLDIPSAERLEAALRRGGGYEGTLILVTHDRALLEATCDRLVILDGAGGVREFAGTYGQWAVRPAPPAPDAPAPAAPDRRQRPAAPRPAAGGAVEPLSQQRLEQRIEELERRIGDIDRLLLDPDVYTDGPRCRGLQEQRRSLTGELEPLEEEWARRAEGA